MKSLITALFILAAQQTFAATLHCDVFHNGMIPFAEIELPSTESLEIKTETYTIGTLGGLDVIAEVFASAGNEFVQVYTVANGVRVGSGTRLLLIDASKNALDVRCELKNKATVTMPPMPPGAHI